LVTLRHLAVSQAGHRMSDFCRVGLAVSKARLFFAVSIALSISTTLLTSCGTGVASTPPPHSPPLFQVTVTPPAPGTGIVTSNPSGIHCPTTCTAGFPQGAQVKLTATPASSYFFKGWGAACSGTSTCRLTMPAKHSVTASFAAISSGGGGGTSVIAYICTPDALSVTPSEFALLANGEPRATTKTFQPWLMAGIAQGLVVDLPGRRAQEIQESGKGTRSTRAASAAILKSAASAAVLPALQDSASRPETGAPATAYWSDLLFCFSSRMPPIPQTTR
jgi:hypothetical protein